MRLAQADQEAQLCGAPAPARFDYQQRDRLVADAYGAALESGNEDWVMLMDLAHLASQHQLSPYSVMKFGPLGELPHKHTVYLPVRFGH